MQNLQQIQMQDTFHLGYYVEIEESNRRRS